MEQAKVYAYLRVSTDVQNIASQKAAVFDYAQKQGFGVIELIEIGCSSRRSTRERRIDELLERLREGDTLLVPELSRLGRSVGEVIMIVDELVKIGVKVVCIKENLHIDGERDIQTNIMVTLLGLFAQIERDLISMRTREGLLRARAEGKVLGRPRGSGKSKLDPYREEIVALLKTGSTRTYLSRKYRVTPPTLSNWLKKHKINVRPEV